jgi:ferredoxin
MTPEQRDAFRGLRARQACWTVRVFEGVILRSRLVGIHGVALGSVGRQAREGVAGRVLAAPSHLQRPEGVMAEKHAVRFEPVGIDIEVAEDQTILRAAAAQGIMLMHGCKEGQCSSCKSFVLDGDDIELEKYSTFALPDFEREEGYTLLCRAHVYEDVTIELLNYDEDMIRSGLPIQEAEAQVLPTIGSRTICGIWSCACWSRVS